ncbi:unnamed protein product [Polarella glacialis]|uniref:Uncharacterized protein n=1 Tax=Polarella glacialis TaxID=89957 RepID=A0A813G0S3_POLGL|nr:unnamed protein product [Polarella glacialis]
MFNVLMIRWFRPYRALIKEASDEAVGCVEEVVELCAKLVTRKEFFDLVRHAMQESLAYQFEQMDVDTEKILEKEPDVVHTQNDYYTVTLRKLQKALAKGTEMLPEEEESDAEDGVAAHDELLDLDAAAEELADPDAEQRVDGMISARRWLSKKLRVRASEAKRLQVRYESQDPKDMHALDLQLSAFCYDKVRRKRVCDDLMKNVRHYLLNFLEEDPGSCIRGSLDNIPHQQVHERLTKQSLHERQQRQQLETHWREYTELLSRIDSIAAAGQVSASGTEWGKWKDRRRQSSESSSSKRPRLS